MSMTKLPLSVSCVSRIGGRFGIACAAAKHIELMTQICETVESKMSPPLAHDIVYHHAAPPQQIPGWYAGKKVIGYWVVESSLANPDWLAAADACSQIWTCSTASARAIESLGSKTPVKVIPHPVTFPAKLIDRTGRDTVKTLFAFAPGWERKNPEGTIEIWKKAFPKSNKKARLIVKCRTAGPAMIRLLEVLTQDDDRIRLITEDITDAEMQALYDEADIFLSAHRAGAFEMHIAEAAASGMPIVCTAVGGVLDYLPLDGLERGSPTAPRMEDALNRAGEWMEPDAEAMVATLQKLGRSEKARLRVGLNCYHCAHQFINEDFVRGLMTDALTQVQAMPAPPKVLPRQRRAMPVVVPMTPSLKPIRTGLEVMSADARSPSPLAPVVISHRRSGTHLLGELMAKHWSLTAWLKTHDFPERRPCNHPAVYVLRNPIDALWETWRWFRTGGGAGNEEIAKVMDEITFADWLNGAAGFALGYQSWRAGPVDNFEVSRGQMYDPIRYWRDHWRAAAEAGISIVLFEDLVTAPEGCTPRLVDVLRRPPDLPLVPMTNLVGMQPDPDNGIGKAFHEWPPHQLARLGQLLSPDLMRGINRPDLRTWFNSKD